MDLQLGQKVALVTAASQGIGKATAWALAREGATVAICARDRATTAATAAQIAAATGAEVRPFVADLSNAESIADLVADVLRVFGTVHVLVNNAGGPPPGGFATLTDEEWQRAFELTLMSAVRVTRAVLPAMRAQRWGRIINLASYSVKQPIPDILLSNSLRLGVVGWAKSIAAPLAAVNVLVNTVATGWARSERVEQMLASRAANSGRTIAEAEAAITSQIPLGRMGTVEEIADVVAFLASERASYLTGTVIPVDGGLIQGSL
jgi:3-oxoacyl-[acyl-carrier protein] reductase